MTVALKPYSRMKETGFECLGSVPTHWALVKLGQIGVFSKGSGGTKEDTTEAGVPCVRYGDLYTSHNFRIEKAESCISLDRAQDYTPVRHGDLLFAGSGETIEEIGKSAVNLFRSRSCCGGDVILFRPKRIVDPRYMGYATDCASARTQKARMGRGITVMHIYGSELKRMNLVLPPVHEQTAIARFLDYMDRRITRYIRAKEKLIVLLEEYKQALIHQTVTGQIDVSTGQPYAEYKDSGVAWLGNVPKRWAIASLRYIGTKFGSGVTPRGGAATYVNTGILFLRSQNIHFDGLHLNGAARISKETHDSQIASHVKPGDVLLNITGASIGRVCPVPEPFEKANVNQHVCIIRPRREKVMSEFLALYLSTPAIQQEIQVEQSGASREGLTLHSIRGFKVALPPIEIQKIVLATLSARIDKVTIAKNALKETISLLNDYRTRVNADIVTGKLDVREVAANLPDPDPLESAPSLDDLLHGEGRPELDEDAELA